MKTLDEVKAHLAKVGYRSNAIPVIEGFLFGKGLYEGDEFEMEFIFGDNNFFDFKDWFNGKDEKKSEIDWSEFGFGDFIHVQEGIDVVLLGGICGRYFACFNGKQATTLVLTEESRPCNEDEIEKVVRQLNANGLNFCFVDNEFKPFTMCDGCVGCKEETENSKEIDELNKSYKELCKITDSMSEDNPFKSVAKTIVESLGKMVDEVNECDKDDSELIDELEIDAKEAIENIIANIHAGTMDEKERENVISALKGLVELGNMYE
jgi:hypothetical protein